MQEVSVFREIGCKKRRYLEEPDVRGANIGGAVCKKCRCFGRPYAKSADIKIGLMQAAAILRGAGCKKLLIVARAR